jgi:hypothetical protein
LGWNIKEMEIDWKKERSRRKKRIKIIKAKRSYNFKTHNVYVEKILLDLFSDSSGVREPRYSKYDPSENPDSSLQGIMK